jgi:hypothetical protein
MLREFVEADFFHIQVGSGSKSFGAHKGLVEFVCGVAMRFTATCQIQQEQIHSP